MNLLDALFSSTPSQSPRKQGALPSYLLDEQSRNWVDSSWDEVRNNTARIVAPMQGVSTRVGAIGQNNQGDYVLVPKFEGGNLDGFFTAMKKNSTKNYPKSKSLMELLNQEHRLHEDYLSPQADYWYGR